jgi:hypothetical protein
MSLDCCAGLSPVCHGAVITHNSTQTMAVTSASRTMHAAMPIANATSACAECGCTLSVFHNSSLIAQIPATVKKGTDASAEHDVDSLQWIMNVPYDGSYVLAVSVAQNNSNWPTSAPDPSRACNVAGTLELFTCTLCHWFAPLSALCFAHRP